jgi:hypothetical protein
MSASLSSLLSVLESCTVTRRAIFSPTGTGSVWLPKLDAAYRDLQAMQAESLDDVDGQRESLELRALCRRQDAIANGLAGAAASLQADPSNPAPVSAAAGRVLFELLPADVRIRLSHVERVALPGRIQPAAAALHAELALLPAAGPSWLQRVETWLALSDEVARRVRARDARSLRRSDRIQRGKRSWSLLAQARRALEAEVAVEPSLSPGLDRAVFAAYDEVVGRRRRGTRSAPAAAEAPVSESANAPSAPVVSDASVQPAVVDAPTAAPAAAPTLALVPCEDSQAVADAA